MKAKIWIAVWLAIVIASFSLISSVVYKTDPFFHYHKPYTDRYFYALDNERSQNDGISKHFDYDTIITGTSMTENFRTTEADKLFGGNSIKVAYSGGSYREINDNIVRALKANPNVKTVIRCLDMDRFGEPVDKMRNELGTYPTYLYDNNPFNDLNYVFNREILFGRTYQMILEKEKEDFVPGITSFDDYERWQERYVFGIHTVSPEGLRIQKAEEELHLSEEDRKNIEKNIEMNVTSVAKQFPDVDFYYFYAPYSIAWWNSRWNDGKIYWQLEAEKYTTELILPYENIHLFSFNNRTDITTDLNNYKDKMHYGSWINSIMLRWMHDGTYRLTYDNYEEYCRQEQEFYTGFDYESINGQTDYEADFYAGALLNNELTGAEPLDVLHDDSIQIHLNKAEYIWDQEYIGAKFQVDLDKGYKYLCFNGRKIQDHGRLTVYVYNESGELVSRKETNYTELDNEMHQYTMDLSGINGVVTVILNGGYVDSTGSADSDYQFSDIWVY